MSRLTDVELSPTAAQRMLRSIARRDWAQLDQTSALAVQRPSVFVEAIRDVVDDIDEAGVIDDVKHDHGGEDDERAPTGVLPWPKSGGGWWYLNEVPDWYVADSEKEPWRSDRLIDLGEPPELGAA